MPALITILGLLALVWGTIYLARGSLLVGGLAFILAGNLFGHQFASFHLGPIPLTVDRILLVVLFVAYAVHWRLGRTQRASPTGADYLAAAFAAVLVASTFTHAWRTTLPEQISPVYRLLAGYLMPLVLYWIARQAPLSERHVKFVQAALAIFGLYLGVTAVLEITQQWWAVFPQHIADPKVGIHFGRARGPMVQSVSLGLALAVCLLCALVWWPRLKRPGQLLLGASLPLYFAGLYFSYTRSVWIGTALGLMIVLGLVLAAPWRRWVLGGMVAAGLIFAATGLDSLLAFQREFSANNTRESAALRGSFAYVSWMMFLDRPLLGVGFGHFPEEKLPYLADRSTELKLAPIRDWVHHNTLLSLLTETGAVGLGLFLALLATWGRDAWRIYRDAQAPAWIKSQAALSLGVLGVYLCQSLFHELSYTPLDNSLVFFLVGVTMSLKPLAATTPHAIAMAPLRQTVGASC